MSIKTAYLSKLGRNYKVSDHFTLGEFASKDGADLVKYSTKLLFWLEELRRYGDFTIEINSGYRTASYNRAIGGASKSQHVAGNAADITVKRNGQVVDAALICCLCQYLDFPGIAYISPRSVHVDMRENGTYRGDERKGYRNNVGDFYEYFDVKKSEVQALIVNREEDEMAELTQEKFNSMMNVWISQQAEKEPSGWSAEARKWAEENNIIAGTGAGYSYLSYCTREQMVQFLYNLYQEFIAKMGGDSSPAVLDAMIKALEGLKK